MADRTPVIITLKGARRLALAKQHLSGKTPRNPGPKDIMDLMEDMRYIQIDPTSAVAPSHLLVLWSRLGKKFRPADLDQLLWKEKKLMEYWAHNASIVLTGDYPLFAAMMKTYARGELAWEKRYRRWVESNSKIRDSVLKQLKQKGPLLTSEIEDDSRITWESAWNSARKVPLILEFLSNEGTIVVAGRSGRQKRWDLAERFLPDWTPRRAVTDDEAQYEGAQLSLRALGVATPRQIAFHFLQRYYSEIRGTVARLVSDSKLVPVRLVDGPATRDEWYIHADDIDLARSLEEGEFEPRTTLLSPFDNLTTDRDRMHKLFDFFYRIEIYTPKAKRIHGYFVLPVLDGDRLVGRVSPVMDREKERLSIHGVHAEPGAPEGKAAARRISHSIHDLADFLGAKDVVYSPGVPEIWRSYLR